ncbi:tyrosine-type recombinase/integrase [Bacillus sp. RO1]|uniref:tyrosine-type recombinase/integrase n=1 Tax=Bacillus sp. RO1 TaxID=2722703 RepID=UPI00145663F7|nr:tyrosine-type recombinase/integrase [Bacillus sp. RO1]NLP52027.1 tyrosine-type recombinase/integrase [Bacillus sp. RO1]
MTLQTCLTQFRDEYMFRLEETTLYCYLLAVNQLIEYGNKPLEEVMSSDIRRWMSFLDARGYKPVTLKTKLAGIKLFFKFCVEEGILSKNPVESIPYPEVNDTLPHYLQMSELALLRTILKGRIEERAVIEIFFATGVRLKELVSMKKEEIYWPDRMITIPKGKRKKERIVLFTREAGEHLKAYLDVREDELPFVFVNYSRTGEMCPRTIQSRFDSYSKKLGRHVSPHTLRHTFAAHLSRRGMPFMAIQTLLGHNSPHQTHLYTRLYHQARKDMYDEWM